MPQKNAVPFESVKDEVIESDLKWGPLEGINDGKNGACENGTQNGRFYWLLSKEKGHCGKGMMG